MTRRLGRRRVRYFAAGLAAAAATLYFLIGVGMLRVVEGTAGAPDLLEFGAMAGGAFVFGAVLLLISDRRVLWLIGALLQVVVIVCYVAAAEMRTPAFEMWGMTIKALQALLLVTLAYLAIRPAAPAQHGNPARVAARA